MTHPAPSPADDVACPRHGSHPPIIDTPPASVFTPPGRPHGPAHSRRVPSDASRGIGSRLPFTRVVLRGSSRGPLPAGFVTHLWSEGVHGWVVAPSFLAPAYRWFLRRCLLRLSAWRMAERDRMAWLLAGQRIEVVDILIECSLRDEDPPLPKWLLRRVWGLA